uniref:Cadherin domain-containing protein n=1 Tax=Macrostomum lignano TaxID=282301 RepID=A0A1I8HV79_9PLAT
CCFADAAGPCEYFDGSGRVQLELQFTESYGGRDGDHLPTLGEVRPISEIYGKVRHLNSSASAATKETVWLRPWDDKRENRWHNGSQFRPLEVYFKWTIDRGVMMLRLKQGIDREILNIYTAGSPGVTSSDAAIWFHIECTPDSPKFSQRNFTVKVHVIDVNDKAPQFYNSSMNTNETMKNFSITGTPSNMPVFSGLSVRDADAGPNAQVVAFMHRHSLFRLADNSPEIRLVTKSAVHYEYFGSQPAGVRIDVVIVAVMALTSQIHIRVAIAEDDDPPPSFEVPGCFRHSGRCIRPTYFAQGAGGGVNVSTEAILIKPGPIRVEAHSGYGIRYSLVNNEKPPYFRIDNFTGEVFQLRPIEDQITLIVKAIKWTDRFDPYLGQASFALLHVSAELAANSTEPSDKVEPRRCYLWSVMIAVIPISLLILTAIFVAFYCCTAKSAGCTESHPRDQEQQQQEHNNDSNSVNSKGHRVTALGAAAEFDTIANTQLEQSTDSVRHQHSSYSSASSDGKSSTSM